MFIPLSEYLVSYVIIPSAISIIIFTAEHVLYKKLKNPNSQIHCVSTGFILIFAVIYTVHVSFYPFILLFCVPMLMSGVYGNKKITGILCAESIIAKIVSDIILGTLLVTRDMNKYHTFSEPMSILNMVMFAIVMIIICRLLSIMVDIEDKKRSLSEELEYEKNHDKNYRSFEPPRIRKCKVRVCKQKTP